MDGPITWRNVTGPSLAEASRPLDSAARLFLGGMDSFNNVLQKQEVVDKANWQQQKENNTNEFLNQVYAAHGPEGFKALQDSGQLQQMIAGFGAQIDQAKAREVMDTRMGTLQKKEQDSWAYQNAALDHQEAPAVDEAKGLIAQGKLDEANPKIAALSTRAQAQLYNSVDAKSQELLQRKWAAEKHPLELDKLRAEISNSRTSGALNSLNLKKGQLEFQDLKETRDLQNVLATARQQHLANDEAVGKAIGALTKELKLPTSAAGYPRFSEMTPEQIALYDETATKRGVPLSSAYLSGDTNAADAFKKQLFSTNKFRPETLMKYNDSINGAFDTTAGQGLVGNDAQSKKLEDAKKKVYYDDIAKNSWYDSNNANARKNFEGIQEKLKAEIKEPRDLAAVNTVLDRIATDGIEVVIDGKKKNVIPSQEAVMAAIRGSTPSSWRSLWLGEERETEFESLLKKAAKRASVAKMMAEGADESVYRRDEAVKAIVNAGKK